jgi:DNA repair exonuclease SbcCD nuclease subunit
MKFAHLADCHLGGWREGRLRELNMEAFRQAIDICVKENTAFVLISGDLFDIALPSIEILKEATENLRKLKRKNIDCYIIPGSHDFSVSGKSMIDVLEKAGLVVNVGKFDNGGEIKLKFVEDKTGIKITGMLGRKRGLEKSYYEILNKDELEKEKGFKIFMFHSTLDELKPEELQDVESYSVRLLPRNFNYYAGGHLHYVIEDKNIVYPGALFPNNFSELEKDKHGGFYIVDVKDGKTDLKFIELKLKDVVNVKIDANGKSAEKVEDEIRKNLEKDVEDKIVLLTVSGVLNSGKPSDIDFRGVLDSVNAYCILKNTNKLIPKEIEELSIKSGNTEDIENETIKEFLEKDKFMDFKIVETLLHILNIEKQEGEKNIDFEERVFMEVNKILKI